MPHAFSKTKRLCSLRTWVTARFSYISGNSSCAEATSKMVYLIDACHWQTWHLKALRAPATMVERRQARRNESSPHKNTWQLAVPRPSSKTKWCAAIARLSTPSSLMRYITRARPLVSSARVLKRHVGLPPCLIELEQCHKQRARLAHAMDIRVSRSATRWSSAKAKT